MALSPATQRAFDSIVSQQVRQQIKTLLRKKDLVFPVFEGSKSVESSHGWAWLVRSAEKCPRCKGVLIALQLTILSSLSSTSIINSSTYLTKPTSINHSHLSFAEYSINIFCYLWLIVFGARYLVLLILRFGSFRMLVKFMISKLF